MIANLPVGVLQGEREHVAGSEDEMLGVFSALFRRRQGGLFRVLPVEGSLPEQFLLVQPRNQFVHDRLQGSVRSGKWKDREGNELFRLVARQLEVLWHREDLN